MELLTAEQMRNADRLTMEAGIPGRVLMESAGRGAARIFLNLFKENLQGKAGIACGCGNNGGDGFVVARYLKAHGVEPVVYLFGNPEKLAGDARANYELLGPMGIRIQTLATESDLAGARTEMAGIGAWVDALFGTGLKENLRGIYPGVIETINSFNRPVLAIDIPSGINSDTGQPSPVAIKAEVTVTFGHPKPGHVMPPGFEYTKRLHVIDIGIPEAVTARVEPDHAVITDSMLSRILKPRQADIHKGKTGHVLVLAGSTGKAGAALLCATSVLRAGAGLVTLGIPENISLYGTRSIPEIMTLPLPPAGDGVLGPDAARKAIDFASDKACIAMGPGIGTNEITKKAVDMIISEANVPVVIDADGINNIASDPGLLEKRKHDTVLTPHPGEMARLTGLTPADVQKDRIGIARSFATKYKVVLILKGARTIVATPEGKIYINPTGNPGMASAGMGDILTGLIAGVIAQGYSAADASCLGVYLHGASADILAQQKGPYGYLASEVQYGIPETFKRLQQGKPMDIYTEIHAEI